MSLPNLGGFLTCLLLSLLQINRQEIHLIGKGQQIFFTVKKNGKFDTFYEAKRVSYWLWDCQINQLTVNTQWFTLNQTIYKKGSLNSKFSGDCAAQFFPSCASAFGAEWCYRKMVTFSSGSTHLFQLFKSQT